MAKLTSDFRSVFLGPPEWYSYSPNKIYREVGWSPPLYVNGSCVIRNADPEQNELSNGAGEVIQNPLQILGVRYPVSYLTDLLWLDGVFQGFIDPEFLSRVMPRTHQKLLLEYLETHMDLHNWEGRPVIEGGF